MFSLKAKPLDLSHTCQKQHGYIPIHVSPLCFYWELKQYCLPIILCAYSSSPMFWIFFVCLAVKFIYILLLRVYKVREYPWQIEMTEKHFLELIPGEFWKFLWRWINIHAIECLFYRWLTKVCKRLQSCG